MRGGVVVRASRETVANAVEAYRGGMSCENVLLTFKLGKARLWRAVEAAGLSRRRRGAPKRIIPNDGSATDARLKRALYRVVRISDGAVLSGGWNRASAVRQCCVINTYQRIAEVRAPRAA